MNKYIKIILNIFIFLLAFGSFSTLHAGQTGDDFTKYRDIDSGTFNEYRYKLAGLLFDLRSNFKVDEEMNLSLLTEIETVVNQSYFYLPSGDLVNKNFEQLVLDAVKAAKKMPSSEPYYNDITEALTNYLEKTHIEGITGDIDVIPKEGNAPLNVTFIANLNDPSGTIIPSYNYVWWIDLGKNRKKIIGNGKSINYTFKTEGNYTVKLDVRSNHRNDNRNTDILSYRGNVKVKVGQKVASLVINVNGQNLGNKDILKFTPDEARYGLLFDATSSVPNGSTTFIETSWDFGNGDKRSYSRGPKVERVIYNKEGEYDITLKMKTNLGVYVQKKFTILVANPVASIKASQTEGFLGDKFTFSAQSATKQRDLLYKWEILDIKNDKVIKTFNTKLFTYTFENKGYYNVKLRVEGINSINTFSQDNKVIYINSRPPKASFKTSIVEKNKPNRILLDGSDSYDLDYTDNGRLEYSWKIDGKFVDLENANKNNSVGYYTFNSIGDHTVELKVVDLDGISGILSKKVKINSILSVDFSPTRIAVKRGDSIRFIATSKEASIFEWDFGDGYNDGGTRNIVTHKYEKSGVYNVKLKVRDKQGRENTQTKVVYIGDGENPIGIMSLSLENGIYPSLKKGVCDGNDAYVVNRVDKLKIDASNSIDVDGKNTGLNYSVKIGNNKYLKSSFGTYKFDELGCFPIKLVVTSKKTGKTDKKEFYVKVENLPPSLSGISTDVVNIESDPVIVDVKAVGAKDRDGVITSYLWYYYTDVDNDPQDFRATSKPETKFVLPKITGNYYFVVVLKDDNDVRVSSEDLGRKSSITLAGDNINVPLVTLTTGDNSIAVGDEVIFTSSVKNILGQNITKKAQYFWDFDGDGFYDEEGSSNIVKHKYEEPGEFYAKLKVKYKGFSNTRSVTINVVNKMKADFQVISIGNKHIFINNSTGVFSNIIWDLGDGHIEKGKNLFIYKYTDNKNFHEVGLKIEKSGKKSYISKLVKRNVKNLIKAKKDGFKVFSSEPINSDQTIVLNKKKSEIYFYLGENKGDISEYAVDLNSKVDSDLNGTKNDDVDIKNSNGLPLKIKLDKNPQQNITLFIKNKDGELIDSYDLTIIKNYIKESEVDLKSITFDNILDSDKEKIEELKGMISLFPEEHKMRGMMYLSRLKEEWRDNTEKTKVILDFESFLGETNISNKNDIINLLESLLVNEEEDKSEQNIAFNALKNLLPSDITCTDLGESKTCKEYYVKKLKAIKESGDVETNKKLGKEILSSILASKEMTTQEKRDFKSILKGLIYGSSSNVPKDEIEYEPERTTGFFDGILSKILIAIAVLSGIFLLLGIGYFIYYKISSKGSKKDFGEFIKDKSEYKEEKDISNDIFSSIGKNSNSTNEKKKDKEIKKSNSNDILSFSNNEVKKEENIEKEQKSSNAPDWLIGSNSVVGVDKSVDNKNAIKKTENKILEKKVIESNSIKEEKKSKNKLEPELENKLENKPKVTKIEKKQLEKNIITDEQIEKETQIDSDIPDWLKGSFETPKKNAETKKTEVKKTEIKKEIPEVKKVEKKQEKVKKSKSEITNLEEKKSEKNEKPKVEEIKENKKDEENIKINNTSGKDEENILPNIFPENNLDGIGKNDSSNSGELWDNGMDVPDWLKSDDENKKK